MEHRPPSPFVVGPVAGYSPQIGHLVTMMHYVRTTTLGAVRGLTPEQLDARVDESGNSIGMLLAHVAALEVSYQVRTFEGRELNDDERHELGPALGLGEVGRRAIAGHDLPHYLSTLEAVRTRTLEEFASRDDAWLYHETPWWDGLIANTYFMWFHVFEDELNHRGQIRVIRRGIEAR